MDHLAGTEGGSYGGREVSDIRDTRVAIRFGGSSYTTTPPYHPARRYPEYPFDDALGNEPNPAYDLVHDLFVALNFDSSNAGTARWNPLGYLIRPGNTVLLKPNFVVSRHGRGGDLFSAITHPSVLRALLDYAFIALEGNGRLIIADSPQMDCDWEELMRATRLDLVSEFYRRRAGIEVELLDLRDFAMIDPNDVAYSTNRKPLPGDPLGEVVFDLGDRSHFAGLRGESSFYGADFNRAETIRNHSGGSHRYGVSRTVLGADAVLSVPKLKVHKKVGVTLNTKGLVGITTKKNYLVHYRLGSPSAGGDQLPNGLPSTDRAIVRVQRYLFDKLLARQTTLGDLAYRAARSVYRNVVRRFVRRSRVASDFDGGNWHGNDTAWRMALDLLKIFLYGDVEGRLHSRPQRKMLCIIDGIVAGENDGPLFPDAKPVGCLIGGINPLAVDLVATRLMGFDPSRVPQFRALEDSRGFDWGFRVPSEIEVLADDPEMRRLFESEEPFLAFIPHPGWTGYIEPRATHISH